MKQLNEITELVESRLSYPSMPFYEKERLKSLIEPLTIEEAKELSKKIPGVSNFITVGDLEKYKDLLEKGYIQEFVMDEEDEEELRKMDSKAVLFGINSDGLPIWNCFCETDWILNNNIIRFK